MILDNLTQLLGWSALINYVFLLVWFAVFAFAKDGLYNLHTNWFDISKEQFNLIHYSGMAFYKLLINFFALVPFFILLFLK